MEIQFRTLQGDTADFKSSGTNYLQEDDIKSVSIFSEYDSSVSDTSTDDDIIAVDNEEEQEDVDSVDDDDNYDGSIVDSVTEEQQDIIDTVIEKIIGKYKGEEGDVYKDKNGNITQMTKIGPDGKEIHITFEYDDEGRLISAQTYKDDEEITGVMLDFKYNPDGSISVGKRGGASKDGHTLDNLVQYPSYTIAPDGNVAQTNPYTGEETELPPGIFEFMICGMGQE